MGDVSHIAVTGAAGLVGRHVVGAARARGLAVTAVIRGAPPDGWELDPQLHVLRCDLAEAAADPVLDAGLTGVQGVIHLAAHVGGDAARHARDTVGGTERLLAALSRAKAHRMVLLSSIAIYDAAQAAEGRVTEDTPLLPDAPGTDAYARAKLRQEVLCRAAAEADGYGLWLARAGIVWGPGHLHHAHLGLGLGPWLIRIGRAGALPLMHVERLAELLLAAVQLDPGGTEPVNMVDPDQPDRDRYIAALRPTGWPRRVLPTPYAPWRALAGLTAPLGARRPGLLQPAILHRRMGPQRYPDTLLQRHFGPPARERFETLMQAAQARRT